MLVAALVAAPFVPVRLPAFQPKSTAVPPALPAPTEKEIGDAKAKGLVWVDAAMQVYYQSGAQYGKTKRGKFMTKAEAVKAGYHAAKAAPAAK